MAEVVTKTIRGKLSFAKVLPHQLSPNFAKDGNEWKFDVILDADTVKDLKKEKIGDRIKTASERELDDGTVKPAYLGGRPYITLKQAEFKKNGQANEPITIKDILGQPWDTTKELGNETVADVKFVIIDYGPGMKKGIYPRSIRVLELVPYTKEEFSAIDKDDPYYKAAMEAQAEAQQQANDIALLKGSAKGGSDIQYDDELDDSIEDIV